jgi:hypothetical protein
MHREASWKEIHGIRDHSEVHSVPGFSESKEENQKVHKYEKKPKLLAGAKNYLHNRLNGHCLVKTEFVHTTQYNICDLVSIKSPH